MKNLKEILSKSDWKGTGPHLGFGSGPDSDWKIIVVSTIILILAVSAWDFRMFMRINNGGAFAIKGDAQGTDTLDLNKLKNTVQHYQNKGVEFEKIKSGTTTSSIVVDPSL